MKSDLSARTRIGLAILDELSALRKAQREQLNRRASFTVAMLEKVQCLSRRLEKSSLMRWSRAWWRVRSELRQSLATLRSELFELEAALDGEAKPLPPLRSLVDDLGSLESEFAEWSYDRPDRTLSMVSDPVTLEDVSLGSFTILLELANLARPDWQPAFRVVAVEPNPAGSNESVTHPHVNEEQLCVGEGSAAIKAALEEGRVHDFFLIVNSILRTYNPASAYVTLDEWYASPCYECAVSMANDECYRCECCEHEFCCECSRSCGCCSGSFCQGCLELCPECGESSCEPCSVPCGECGTSFCGSCLEDGFCFSCVSTRREEDDGPEEEDSVERDVPVSDGRVRRVS